MPIKFVLFATLCALALAACAGNDIGPLPPAGEGSGAPPPITDTPQEDKTQ